MNIDPKAKAAGQFLVGLLGTKEIIHKPDTSSVTSSGEMYLPPHIDPDDHAPGIGLTEAYSFK